MSELIKPNNLRPVRNKTLSIARKDIEHRSGIAQRHVKLLADSLAYLRYDKNGYRIIGYTYIGYRYEEAHTEQCRCPTLNMLSDKIHQVLYTAEMFY